MFSFSFFADWDYFINTAGTELPIVNYPGFIELIKAGGGSNVLESYRLPHYFKSRINRYYDLER